MEASDIQRFRLRFLIDLAYWAAILTIAYLGLKFLCVMLPLLLAFVFAALVRPVSHFLSRETRYVRGGQGERILVRRKIHLNPTLAGVLSVTVLFLLLGVLLLGMIVKLADSAADLVSAVPGFYETRLQPAITAGYERLLEMSTRLDDALAETLRASVPNLLASLGNAVTGLSGRAVTWLTSLAARLPGILLTTVITMIATVFVSADFHRIKAFIRRNVPERPLHYLMTVRNSFVDMMGLFARSYLLILLITTAENILGLWIIGVSEPVLLGIVIGIVDIFPVVGSGTVLIPWAAVCLIGGELSRGMYLLALYAVITVVRQFLEPRIVGGRVGLRPFVTVACMYVGTRLFGAVGIFALPVMAAILADLNNSGMIHLFRKEEQDTIRDIIHSEGIET